MRQGTGIRLGLASTLAALALALAAPWAQADSSCGWQFQIAGDQLNVAFPDAAARYWVSTLPIPAGFHVEIHGQFPHARYISFMTYDPVTRAVDGIHDSAIVPDAGSSNPFVAGNSRTGTNFYTVKVVNAALPASGRAQNTVYTDNGQSSDPSSYKTSQPTDTTTFIYRLYEPDTGRDIFGGAGLPAVSLVSDDGSQRQQLPDCPEHSLPSTLPLTQGIAGAGSGPANDSVPSVELGGQDPPVWLKYSNLVNGVANGVLNNPRTGAAWPAVQSGSNMLPRGGFYDNLDNAYMTAFDSASYGDVLVFHGKAASTPQTLTATTMGAGQLRYWSMCVNTTTTQYTGCVKDDDVKLDAQGYYTIVISTAANRPATTVNCPGIEWLPKGPTPSVPVILRNMLPDPTFGQAVQDIPAQGQEQATLGPYYPQGYYFDHAADFNGFVNANGGCGAFSWPYSNPPTSYQPKGFPVIG